jgi:hypothetical protein
VGDGGYRGAPPTPRAIVGLKPRAVGLRSPSVEHKCRSVPTPPGVGRLVLAAEAPDAAKAVTDRRQRASQRYALRPRAVHYGPASRRP